MASVFVLEGLEVPIDKHELILSGPEVIKTVKEKGFKDDLWNLHNLNYLSISAELVELPAKTCGLTNLTCLVLHSNKLQTLPVEISKLSKLKILDVSRNSLATIPDELSKLSQLSTLNLSSNNLTAIPSLRENVKLSSINLSCNKFEKFPDCCYQELSMLSDINLSSNEITYISGDINKLQTLKVLDLSDNKILEIPAELSLLTKLKELNLKGNKLKDRRLMKMVDQCHSKKVIDFIKHHYGKQVGSHAVRRESLRSSLSEDKENTIEEVKEKPKFVIQVSKPVLKGLEVSVATTVKPVRPGIACCVIRNVSFTEETLKDFIQIQNKFHDTICNKRQKATIGTHDLDLIMSPLKYTALESKDILFVPLGESNPCTAEQFIADKREEAEKLKKEKKRNWLAGVYKYIKMVEGFSNYACLIDANNTVISFPPITNSEVSKITLGTKNIMVEVTSGTEKKVAREVLDKFLKELVKMKITKLSEDHDDNDRCNILELEQVTFIPEKGPKLHYPNDGDLQLSSGDIVRRNLF